MICPKCAQQVPEGSVFCNHCGKRLVRDKYARKTKSRGNGLGTAYLAPNGKSWVALATVYKPTRKTKRKSGFPSKTAALSYSLVMRAELEGNEPKKEPKTLQQVYDEWEPWYEPRVKSMAGYKAAYGHFQPLHGRLIDKISAGDLQACMDACKAGKRTHQMMKVTAGLLWGYAFDRKYVERKITDNLFTGKGANVKREPLTDEEVKTIKNAIGKYRYAEYIYCHCYLGFRPGEMLEIKKDQLHCIKKNDHDIWYLVEGKKTEAGKDRIVTIPDRILPYIIDRSYVPGTDLLFPRYEFERKSKKAQIPKLIRFKEMTDSYFRESVFKPMMAALGIADGKVPYCARHTYSDLLKKAEGEDIDKAALMGHSNYTFTQTNYQSSNLEEMNEITKSL